MHYQRFTLADVDGVLCVAEETADSENPILRTYYWPTLARTYDFCRYWEVSREDLQRHSISVACACDSPKGFHWLILCGV